MASNTRQNTLLANTVWQKLYRTFQQADFKSYDFDTIRRTLIDYLQLNYPESFNDFIESSEYVALIDMISYVAQSISYRVDLNARENFIDLAERKDSVLRLARLISYQPKRNTAGNGFLKITSVSTSETVTDSNGQNIANTPILWNDLTNDNWQDQFNTVINASLPKNQFVNKPEQSDTIGGINSQLYRINGANLDLPTVPLVKQLTVWAWNFPLCLVRLQVKNLCMKKLQFQAIQCLSFTEMTTEDLVLTTRVISCTSDRVCLILKTFQLQTQHQIQWSPSKKTTLTMTMYFYSNWIKTVCWNRDGEKYLRSLATMLSTII